MSQAAGWLIAAAVLALGSACGGASSSESQSRTPSWSQVARTLTPGLDPSSPNLCKRGAPACVDTVVREMDRRFDRLARRCDHGAAFAFMYLKVTDGVRGKGQDGFFTDPPYLNHLDAIFARLYFDAFDAWRTGRRRAVPLAWRIAFDAADRRLVTGIGDMLLGMNAHISRDLPFALAGLGLVRTDGSSGKPDFDKVNELLGAVQEPMLREASERLDPTIGAFTLPALSVDSSTVAELLTQWREEAWQNGAHLRAARSSGRRAAIASLIEVIAAKRAALILAATQYVPLLATTRERDDFCAAHRKNG